MSEFGGLWKHTNHFYYYIFEEVGCRKSKARLFLVFTGGGGEIVRGDGDGMTTSAENYLAQSLSAKSVLTVSVKGYNPHSV